MPDHRANPTDPSLGSAAIHAPWRVKYLESLDAQEKSRPAPPQDDPGGAASFLRDYWLNPQDDEKNHVIVRAGDGSPLGGMILLNAYPYANGHLLVALGEGRPRLLDYAPEQRAALWRLTDAAAALMDAALEPQGINFGINQGRAAGAGVPGHLHVHLVPRWQGDVNFITVVAKVRVIPSSLEAMAARYRAAWERIRADWPL